MTGYYERPVSSLGNRSFFLARLALAILVIGGMGHRYDLIETPGFFWVLGLVFLFAVTAFVVSLFALRQLWQTGAKGGKAASVGLVISVLILVPYSISAWRASTLPPLNDISTDPDDPPAFFLSAGLRKSDENPLLGPDEEDGRMQADAYPEVTGRRYDAAPDRVFLAVNNLLERKGWRVISKREVDDGQLEMMVEARAWTLIFSFPADVSIRIADEDESTYVDMRSASVYAKHDLGDNARRIIRFMNDLDAEMVTVSGG